MLNSEQDIEKLEDQFPELAAAAVNMAYHQALKAGRSVFVSSNTESAIIEVFPNGSTKIIKKIDTPLRVPAGTVVQIP